MKKIALVLLSAGVLLSFPTYSQYSAGSGSGTEESADETATYLKNLATYFGYDVTNPAESPFASLLLQYTLNTATKGHQILNVFFGARPVNYPNFSDFSTNSSYSTFNSQANVLFNDTFSKPAANDSTGVSVVPNFDQKDYQSNPVSQAVMNTLANPNSSLCDPENDDTCLTQNKVMNTALQDVADPTTKYLPSETQFYKNTIVSKFASQLNADTLIGPLLYSQATVQKTVDGALPANNQEQLAMDYARYVTNSVLPVDSMSQSDYSSLWTSAHTQITSSMDQVQKDTIKAARKDLMTYLLRQRVYAAQSSLATSNFYRSMEARMPQTATSDDGQKSTSTSQAFNEFVMATWRLYSPDAASGEQWVDQINKASAATTQKEIAILLSEINYQIYLGRQTQERILLTNSLLSLQSLANNQPNNTTTSVSVSGTSTTVTP